MSMRQPRFSVGTGGIRSQSINVPTSNVSSRIPVDTKLAKFNNYLNLAQGIAKIADDISDRHSSMKVAELGVQYESDLNQLMLDTTSNVDNYANWGNLANEGVQKLNAKYKPLLKDVNPKYSDAFKKTQLLSNQQMISSILKNARSTERQLIPQRAENLVNTLLTNLNNYHPHTANGQKAMQSLQQFFVANDANITQEKQTQLTQKYLKDAEELFLDKELAENPDSILKYNFYYTDKDQAYKNAAIKKINANQTKIKTAETASIKNLRSQNSNVAAIPKLFTHSIVQDTSTAKKMLSRFINQTANAEKALRLHISVFGPSLDTAKIQAEITNSKILMQSKIDVLNGVDPKIVMKNWNNYVNQDTGSNVDVAVFAQPTLAGLERFIKNIKDQKINTTSKKLVIQFTEEAKNILNNETDPTKKVEALKKVQQDVEAITKNINDPNNPLFQKVREGTTNLRRAIEQKIKVGSDYSLLNNDAFIITTDHKKAFSNVYENRLIDNDFAKTVGIDPSFVGQPVATWAFANLFEEQTTPSGNVISQLGVGAQYMLSVTKKHNYASPTFINGIIDQMHNLDETKPDDVDKAADLTKLLYAMNKGDNLYQNLPNEISLTLDDLEQTKGASNNQVIGTLALGRLKKLTPVKRYKNFQDALNQLNENFDKTTAIKGQSVDKYITDLFDGTVVSRIGNGIVRSVIDTASLALVPIDIGGTREDVQNYLNRPKFEDITESPNFPEIKQAIINDAKILARELFVTDLNQDPEDVMRIAVEQSALNYAVSKYSNQNGEKYQPLYLAPDNPKYESYGSVLARDNQLARVLAEQFDPDRLISGLGDLEIIKRIKVNERTRAIYGLDIADQQIQMNSTDSLFVASQQSRSVFSKVGPVKRGVLPNDDGTITVIGDGITPVRSGVTKSGKPVFMFLRKDTNMPLQTKEGKRLLATFDFKENELPEIEMLKKAYRDRKTYSPILFGINDALKNGIDNLTNFKNLYVPDLDIDTQNALN